MTVRASFTFRNQGGAPATGVRVRFNLPEGLVYLVGSGTLDGGVLDDEQGNSPLLARAGADIGDVQPGEERRIDLAYSVAGAIENGSTVELQAAVTAFELPPVGSNIVRLVARSRPALENALTGISLESRSHEPRAGGEATVTVRVHNAGESSARDVVAVAPVPEHTTYVPNSARVNGRELERDLPAPFDRVHAPVIAQTLPASATVTLQYRVRIDEPLADNTVVAARLHVASQETPAFTVEPAAITVRARAEFADERTAFSIEPASDAAPGSRVQIRLTAYNAGTAAAQDAAITVTLADGLHPVRGAARLDGQPVREKKNAALSFDLGTVPARETVELALEAVVATPIADGSELPVRAVLRWNGGEREFERTLTVRSRPYLHRRRNGIDRTGPVTVRPADEIEAAIAIGNDGSAAAHDCVLQLQIDPALDDVRVFDKNTRLDLTHEGVELGTLDAYASRKLTVRARVRSPYADRSEIALGAVLHAQELGEVPLGSASWRVESHPAFSSATSSLTLVQDEVFRPNQLVDVHVRLRNEGTDNAQNVRLRLYVSPEARIESVDGATRDRSTLTLGEILAGATAEIRLGVRLLRSLARTHPVAIEGVVTADAMLPVQLAPLTIVTTAEPNFAIGTLRTVPEEIADAGEEIEFVLHVRNSGDGPARRAKLTLEPDPLLIYLPNSTSVNDVPVRDAGAQSPLIHERGLLMSDVDPGVEATVRWREVINNNAPANSAIVRRVKIAYDGDRTDEIAAPEVTVRCAPAFANTISGLPFGLDGMVGPSLGHTQRALTGSEFVELPPATPVSRPMVPERAMLSPAATGNGHGHANGTHHSEDDGGHVAHAVQLLAAFDRDRLDRTMRFVGEARFPGLVTHLFALRAFFPDAIGGVGETTLRELRETIRETLDRIYIKLRVANYVLAQRDLETAAARSALEAVLASLDEDAPAGAAGSIQLRGTADLDELRELGEDLSGAALATALPWAALARLIPGDGEAMQHYRGLLIEALDNLEEADETAFIDALQRRPYPVLDAALDVVRAQLTAVRA